MLLIEFTINGTVNYLSTEYIKDLTHSWRGKITEFSPPQMNLPYIYGGYCEMQFGSISFFPDLFSDDWPPPISGALTAKYTATTEGAAETLFSGLIHLQSISREDIRYGMYTSDYDETVADATNYNGTLDATITTILTGISEITTVNTDNARASSPNVYYTTSREDLNIGLASNIAAFHSHLFYIDGSTAYLVDMLGDTGTTTKTEFHFFPAVYPYESPVSGAKAWDILRSSSYPYGDNELSPPQMFTPSEITGATQANPCVITCVGHPFSNGDSVRVSQMADDGMIELNGNDYTVANKGADTFELSGINSGAYTAYTSGGEAVEVTTINTALDNIITLANRPRIEMAIPFLGSVPTPGSKWTWTDESQAPEGESLDVVMYIRNINYDFNPDNDQIVLKGDGALT